MKRKLSRITLGTISPETCRIKLSKVGLAPWSITSPTSRKLKRKTANLRIRKLLQLTE